MASHSGEQFDSIQTPGAGVNSRQRLSSKDGGFTQPAADASFMELSPSANLYADFAQEGQLDEWSQSSIYGDYLMNTYISLSPSLPRSPSLRRKSVKTPSTAKSHRFPTHVSSPRGAKPAQQDANIDPRLCTQQHTPGQSAVIEETTRPTPPVLSASESSEREIIWNIPEKGHPFWRTFDFEGYMLAAGRTSHIPSGTLAIGPEVSEYPDAGLYPDVEVWPGQENQTHPQFQGQSINFPEYIPHDDAYDATQFPVHGHIQSHGVIDPHSTYDTGAPHIHYEVKPPAQDYNLYPEPQQPNLDYRSLYPFDNPNYNQSVPGYGHIDPQIDRQWVSAAPTNFKHEMGSIIPVETGWPAQVQFVEDNSRGLDDSQASPEPWEAESDSEPQNGSSRRKPAGTTKGMKSRAKNIASGAEKAHQLYETPLRQQAWYARDGGGQQHKISYNSYGELDNNLSPTAMMAYVLNRFPAGGKAHMWIQAVPGDSSPRYLTTTIDKCKLKNCIAKRHTIILGSFRVAFDEHANSKYDPFHVAGFVHLYCMERYLDFGEIVRRCNIHPDTRHLNGNIENIDANGRSRIHIDKPVDKKHETLNSSLATKFFQSLKAGGEAVGQGTRPYNYEETLSHMITLNVVKSWPSNRHGQASTRGGNHIGIHLNDLEFYVRQEEAKLKRQQEKKELKSELEKEPLEESHPEPQLQHAPVAEAMAPMSEPNLSQSQGQGRQTRTSARLASSGSRQGSSAHATHEAPTVDPVQSARPSLQMPAPSTTSSLPQQTQKRSSPRMSSAKAGHVPPGFSLMMPQIDTSVLQQGPRTRTSSRHSSSESRKGSSASKKPVSAMSAISEATPCSLFGESPLDERPSRRSSRLNSKAMAMDPPMIPEIDNRNSRKRSRHDSDEENVSPSNSGSPTRSLRDRSKRLKYTR